MTFALLLAELSIENFFIWCALEQNAMSCLSSHIKGFEGVERHQDPVPY